MVTENGEEIRRCLYLTLTHSIFTEHPLNPGIVLGITLMSRKMVPIFLELAVHQGEGADKILIKKLHK